MEGSGREGNQGMGRGVPKEAGMKKPRGTPLSHNQSRIIIRGDRRTHVIWEKMAGRGRGALEVKV